eukprot:364168-Chlamydomonas_euryale.AAC.11
MRLRACQAPPAQLAWIDNCRPPACPYARPPARLASVPVHDGSPPDAPRARRLEAALKSYMIDFAERMTEIKKSLEEPDDSKGGGDGNGEDADAVLERREQLLDELMDIVCSIDHARDLHKIGGLPPLLGLLRRGQPSLKWRAAEVVATCCASNPPVQRWFVDGGVLPPLLDLLGDDNAAVRTKALLALSAIVRHFSPGLEAVLSAPGVPATLAGLCGDADGRVARKACTLVSYILQQRRSAAADFIREGAAPAAARAL